MMKWLGSHDGIRMFYGFFLTFMLGFLAVRVALGHVTEQDSYGLIPLITVFSTLAGAFAQWAFTDEKKPTPKDPEPPK